MEQLESWTEWRPGDPLPDDWRQVWVRESESEWYGFRGSTSEQEIRDALDRGALVTFLR